MNKRKALDAYIETLTQIEEQLTWLREQADNHFGHSPEEINWGHVGSAQHILELLTEAADFTGNRSK